MAKKKYATKWFYAPVGKYTDVETTGWFWNKKSKVVKKDAPRTADYQAFADSLEAVYNDLDAEGYDVHQVLPLEIGASEPIHAVLKNNDPTYLGEVGFSVTRGAIVVGKLRP